jgi:hemoglobin
MRTPATGGPEHDSGRSLADFVRHIEITEQEWVAFMAHFPQTLNGFYVPPPEQKEVKAIIESTHDDTVVLPLQSATP